MQVFFEKNSNFLCICSNTRNCSELTSKCIPNHTLFLFLLYITLSIRIQLPPKSTYRPHPCTPIKNFI